MNSRVLLCSGSLDGGGSERQLWQLAKGLDPARFQACVYLLYRRGVYLDRLPSTVPVFDYWGQQPTQFQLPGAIYRSQVKHLSELIGRQRIELVYDRTFHMTLLTSAACRQAGVPRVSVIVSPPSRDFSRSRERFAFLKKRLLARAYAAQDARTLAVSQDVADDAVEFYGIDSRRIATVPSPVAIQDIRSEASHDFQLPPATFNFCVVGRLSGEKGQRSAVLAFQKYLRSTETMSPQLHLVGDGPDRLQLEELVADLGLAQQVLFHGFLKNPYPLIRNSDMLLIPSQYEGLPNVALEAMVLRTPILATRCSHSLESLLDGNLTGGQALGELVPVGDSDAMAEKMVTFGAQQLAWQKRVEAAERYVETEHDLSRWLRKMEVLFDELIAKRRDGPAAANAGGRKGDER